MDFRFTPEEEAFRKELRAFLKQELPPDWQGGGLEADSESEWQFTLQLRKKLAQKGWLTIAWPKEYGGMGATHTTQLVYNEEIAYHRVQGVIDIWGVNMLAPILMKFGTEEQKRTYLPPIARAEVQWCQGYSEPGSGSDLASLQLKAVEDGDDFVLNGTKIWTSNAHRADHIFVLARTDPNAPKHRGISFILVDMRTKGVQVRPIINMAGLHGFNMTIFDDVRVPKRNLVGEKNMGWYVGAALLDFERSGIAYYAGGKRTLEDLVMVARERHLTQDGRVRNALAELAVEIEAGRLMAYNIAWMQGKGLIPNREASCNKLFGSELQQRLTHTGLALLGLYGQLEPGSKWAILKGRLERAWLLSFSSTIAGGTSEIQRNVIAMRGLGLPRG